MKILANFLEKLNRYQENFSIYRMDFVEKFIRALIRTRTVNLSRIANLFEGKATERSHYHRIQDFFRKFRFDSILFMKILFSLFPQSAYIFQMDRTNWEFGKKTSIFLFYQ